MKSTKTASPNILIIERLQIKETALALILALAIPFLVHFIPAANGTPAGAYLLAMFYAPFIAVAFFKYQTALITALFAPILNYLIIGMPLLGMVPVLTLELAIFVSLAYYLNQIRGLNYLSAPVSYLLAKVVSATSLLIIPALSTVSSPVAFYKNSVFNGLTGLAILAVLSIVVALSKRK